VPDPPLSLRPWWDPVTAVTYLRDRTIPANPSDIDWQLLPMARQETQRLNGEIQAGRIDTIAIMIDDTRRELSIEDKATLSLRFHLDWFVGSGIGTVLEVIDTQSGKPLREVQTLLVRAEQVRALHAASGALGATASSDEVVLSNRSTAAPSPAVHSIPVEAIAESDVSSRGELERRDVKTTVSKKEVDDVIREEIGKVYDKAKAEGTKPPNILELPKLVQTQLTLCGYEVTLLRIKKIGEVRDFCNRRLPQGTRWRGRR
jgi:hypothetical protein